jgi:hypothetical protein
MLDRVVVSGSAGRHCTTLIPSVPRKAFIARSAAADPARHFPIADSLSHTNARVTGPQPLISAQCPARRSKRWRDGIIRTVIIGE